PDAVTPSGTGLRMMQPRAPGDEATGGAGERNDVGFASGLPMRAAHYEESAQSEAGDKADIRCTTAQ
ncbi:MAG: hypothetical protein KC447_12990, partial [Rhodobacteraceae bacterium]|nr:hypothetical protein [Paracoccaceae bacterium]